MKKLTLLTLLISLKLSSQVKLSIDIKESNYRVADSNTMVIIDDVDANKFYTMNASNLYTFLELDKAYIIVFIRDSCISKYIQINTFYCDTNSDYEISSSINLNKGTANSPEFGGVIYFDPINSQFTKKIRD